MPSASPLRRSSPTTWSRYDRNPSDGCQCNFLVFDATTNEQRLASRPVCRDCGRGSLMRPASLLVTDGTTLTVSKLPDGKFQASTLAWTDPAVVGRDQVLEIRTHNGRLYLVRREKIREPE